MRNALVALIFLALAAAPARAARLFKSFDFEERQLGNDEDTPMHWSRVAGPGLPHYVVGRLTNDRARSGRYSFRMDLDGGSCVYQYEPARLPVALGGHYRVSGYCQTTALRHARARLTLTLADAGGEPLPDTQVQSEPYASTADAPGDWHELSAELTDTATAAAYLLVRMELVQPARYSAAPAGDPTLFPEDIRGTAWFDDLVVAQVPRVSLSTDRPGNVFRRGDAPQMSAVLADPSTDDLTSQLIVTDADGRRVFQRTGTIAPSTADTDGPGRRRLAVPLPIVPAGWYRATLRLASPGVGDAGTDDTAAFTGSRSLDYVQLADDAPIVPPDPRFGIVVPGTPAADLADVLPLLSAGHAKLDVTADGSVPLNDLVDRLGARGIEPVGRLPLGTAGPTDLVGRHLGQIEQWQMGADDTDAFVTDPAARRAYAGVLAAFAALTGHPDLAMPCPMGFDPPTGKATPAAVTLSVPPSILPNEIPAYLKDLTDRAAAGGPRVASVSLRPVDAARYGSVARASDLAERVVYGLSSGVDRVDLPLPLTGASAEPTDLLPVERTLLTALSGAASRGRLPVADGVEAFLFERTDDAPGGHGVVVLWADPTISPAERSVPVRLGDALSRTDLWGNVAPLPTTDDGTVVLRVGATPTIITGVDAPLARFRAGVTMGPATIESVLRQPQVRHLHLTNPYSQPIAGTVRLRGPAGWTLSPQTVRFELNVGESIDRDVGIDLPINARAGRNVVLANVELQADRTHQLSLPLPMTVGLSDVGVQSTAFRDGPAGVVVQQRVTNYGERPVDYTAYVMFPGQPRVERLVTALAPGQTVLKRYRFVTDIPTGELIRLRVGLKETDGPKVLNEELTVR
jgi:hypothetical protein